MVLSTTPTVFRQYPFDFRSERARTTTVVTAGGKEKKTVFRQYPFDFRSDTAGGKETKSVEVSQLGGKKRKKKSTAGGKETKTKNQKQQQQQKQ